MAALAHLVKERAAKRFGHPFVSYDEAYAPGFEDMMRRVPSVEKLHPLPVIAQQPPQTQLLILL